MNIMYLNILVKKPIKIGSYINQKLSVFLTVDPIGLILHSM